MIDISTIDTASLGILNKIQKGMYFIDPATSIVYSRKTGTQERLYGSLNNSNVRTYTLQPEIRHRPAVKVRADRLLNAVAKLTKTGSVNTPAPQASHGWVIGSVQDDGRVSFNQKPYQYATANSQAVFAQEPTLYTDEREVNTEIERLAKASPGKKFVKARIEAVVQAAGVVWA